MENLTTATPVEVDTVLASLHGDLARAGQQVEIAIDRLHRAAGDKTSGYGRNKRWGMTDLVALSTARDIAASEGYVAQQAQQAIDSLDAANLAYSDIREEMAVLDAEWIRRGRWTRAFLVITSGKGHVHSSMQCSTCFYDTQYAWLPELSGHDQAEIIKAAGSDACTICYPDAPVNDLKRPRSIFTGDEKAAQAAREERAAAKVARDAKKLEKALLPDGSTLVVDINLDRTDHRGHAWPQRERFETLHSARTWLTDQAQHKMFGWENSLAPAEARHEVAAAVAAKEGKTVAVVLEEAKTRAAKRK